MTDTQRSSDRDLLERAGELQSDGDIRAALELLSDANRIERSSELEVAIVDLRVEGGR